MTSEIGTNYLQLDIYVGGGVGERQARAVLLPEMQSFLTNIKKSFFRAYSNAWVYHVYFKYTWVGGHADTPL